MKRAVLVILCAWTALAQQSEPSVQEQQDLMRALGENTSPVDLMRALEAHLDKYPNTTQRADLERSIAKAAIEVRGRS